MSPVVDDQGWTDAIAIQATCASGVVNADTFKTAVGLTVAEKEGGLTVYGVKGMFRVIQ